MALVVEDTDEVKEHRRIASFAVLDLETSNLPSLNFNKVGITELSVYGFNVSELEKVAVNGKYEEALERNASQPLPRVLHKLTLLMNPRMMVHPDSEKITGLNNYLLEDESSFDENAGNTLIGFLKHLQQPVCLVAHNGWFFDFPIVKSALEKLNMKLPSDTVCLDSLRAFHEIDELRPILLLTQAEPVLAVTNAESADENGSKTDLQLATIETTITEVDVLMENSQTNWRALNETTPKRTHISSEMKSDKRKLLADSKNEINIVTTTPELTPQTPSTPVKSISTSSHTFKSRRCLFKRNATGSRRKKFPPKGVYKLENMYERIFKRRPQQSHYAEADVESLTKLMLHYGNDFVAYAEEHAIPFSEVRKLGANF